MLSPQKLLFAIASAITLVNAAPAPDSQSHMRSAAAACGMLRRQQEYKPAFAGSLQYNNDISHWSNASSLPALCSVQPDTPEEIQRLFGIIRRTRAPWAVKGKGHCNNNEMSSTYGLQIAMSEFSHIELAADKKSVKVGTGLDWGQVYTALAPHGLVVVGGRSPTVGVAGLVLSSGYAWITNEYGFAIDNILEADIVLPNGTFTTVSETRGSDIFYALQGGLNNFGIVTSLTLKTFPIGQVWGGTILYPADALEVMINATAEYSAKPSNPKATLATQFFAVNGTVTGAAIMFYNGPTPPPGLFDDFYNAPGLSGEVKTHDSFLSFVSGGEVPGDADNRATWYSAPILTWTREIIEFIGEMAKEYSIKAAQQSRSIKLVSGNIEPFGPQAYSFNRGSAWPHDPSEPYNTFNGLFQWSDARDDEVAFALTIEYHMKVWEKAIELGISKPQGEVFFPPNYSQGITPSSMIYGPNMPWLEELRQRIDPYDIISLTGGFKI